MRSRRDGQRCCGWVLRVPSRGLRGPSPECSAQGQTTVPAPHPTPPAAPSSPPHPRHRPHPWAALTCNKVSPTLQLWKHDNPVHFKAKFKPHLPCLVLLFSPVDGPFPPPTDATAWGPGDAQRPHQKQSHPRSMVACYGS